MSLPVGDCGVAEPVGAARDVEQQRSGKEIEQRDVEQTLEAGEADLTDQTHYLPRRYIIQVFLTCASVGMTGLLDETMIAVALPLIASNLNTGSQISAVATAYFITSTACQILYGRISDIWSRKSVLLSLLFILFIGNLASSLAQTFTQILVFRAIVGIGGGGIGTSGQIIVSDVVSLKLRQRGKYQGILGSSVALANGVGPIIGGALAGTSSDGWRWIFRLELPLAVLSAAPVIFFMPPKPVDGSILKKLAKLDWVGATFALLGTTTLVLGISWGGSEYPWSSGHVIGTLVAGGVSCVVFILWEWKGALLPLMPLHIYKNRVVIGGIATHTLNGFLTVVQVFYLPTFYQNVYGYSAVKSGAMILPIVLVQTAVSTISGIIITLTGRYRELIISGWAIWTIGLGLITTFDAHTLLAKQVGIFTAPHDRKEDRVKVKGFRVELYGVAAAMKTTLGVEAAVALFIDGEIAGVFATDSVDGAVVRAACAKIQSYCACPFRYITISEMPTMTNGKTDKRQLRTITSCSSITNESGSLDVSSDSSTCPSTASIASDEDSIIPARGRLFVNVIEQEGRTFPPRSSIFSRNYTLTRSRTASEADDKNSVRNLDHHQLNRPLPLDLSPLCLSRAIEDNPRLNLTGENMTQGLVNGSSTKVDEPTDNKALKLVAQEATSILTPPLTESVPPSPTNIFDDRVLFAVPKKGRLHEKCVEMLRSAGLEFTKPNRLDICMAKNMPITLVFLPAADIPRFVGESNVDMGITGQDVIFESKMQALTTESLALGFGRCKLQVQVPVSSGIDRIEDLAGKRIATSFESVAREHFEVIDARLGTKTVVEHLSGSVETACALGLADGIVDLVESGETMRAAGLKAIATIMSSEAVLISSSTPKKPHMLSVAEQLKSRLAGVVASAKYILCQYNIRRTDLEVARKITPG
ncbi:unnamed protein product [Rhizoctonia solani]|uniref:ATP phosphoribosyltransferase catalytic domain-containing protein n=1 Tax=Rhizoctonia solani TaxID=456999 RepID=A0A8H3BAQ8_9AGAM|nr:unnamed protein product [Rhizoctonia solani]